MRDARALQEKTPRRNRQTKTSPISRKRFSIEEEAIIAAEVTPAAAIITAAVAPAAVITAAAAGEGAATAAGSTTAASIEAVTAVRCIADITVTAAAARSS